MRVELVRRADGRTTLRCTRADGSVTWQTRRTEHAAFFALHDLTHYAVETELGFREGFFGLVARGWEIDDTTGKGRRGPLPPEALVVEQLVGALDRERTSPTAWPASEFRALLAPAASRPGAPVPDVTDDALARVRTRVGELAERWMSLGPDEALVLEFDEGAAAVRFRHAP